MSAITYTAKRNIEKVATFVITGAVDISAAAVDDTFNSSSTDLSGLLAGQWIEVIGGANAGWHQLATNSTTNTIATTSALTDEAAGPSIDMQGYVRGYGQSYSFNLDVSVMNPASRENKVENKPQTGLPEILLTSIEDTVSVVTASLHKDSSQLLQLEEFLKSVAAGELFTFDEYGTVAVEDNPELVYKSSNGYNKQRVGVRNRFRVPFSMVKA